MNTMPNTQETNSCKVMDISNRNSNYKNRCVKLRKEIREPVQPIKDISDIQKAKDYLFNREGRYSITNKRDYAIFVLMINIAKRAGDVLNLTVNDILNKNGTFKKEIWIITEKKQKQEVFSLSSSAQEALTLYFEEHPEILEDRNNGLFPSRQSNGKSMGYNNLYAIFKGIEKKINEDKDDNNKVHVATHSARKTWAYHTTVNNKDDAYIVKHVSKVLGHKDEATTNHYLGFDRDTTVKLFQNNGL